ncbi:hypothetical protein PABG_11732 [Paracoccidioides brasiliensis Pb03]|uniref:Uncharacterized protein n=1 Tax=Paracoccidioides brasiliensis (strain Pb18) TaxID=502780 RepID=A0A0A0HVT5_PARBD|nr:uncharacterized protein PADG_11331 [Paracoccidioides brasiliensis Pb18]KGM92508.1 hypothetical protein PADG_11331 [Paracoccidioides brasiliensis Pb18]KGY15425.1 hypothetical protein PABG_11732 [Paracoccidioides brasiliensis Pb03]ODH50862.1 hypothetical protein GX48_03004 [Paracoccidioides brasiliensis]
MGSLEIGVVVEILSFPNDISPLTIKNDNNQGRGYQGEGIGRQREHNLGQKLETSPKQVATQMTEKVRAHSG